jgi:hypothetical protein
MVMRAGLALFMLIGHFPHAVLARNLVNTLPAIFRFLEKHEPPFIARVYVAHEGDRTVGKPGRVELWLDETKWKKLL